MKKYTLESISDLQHLVDNYIECFPTEKTTLETGPFVKGENRSLLHFLKSTLGNDLYSRKNFHGHLTASAFILSADGKSVLLLHHKSLNRWLQPGGHIDDTDASILTAAYREVFEETNLSRDNLTLVSTGNTASIPFDIDSHPIPANPKKQEEAHVHHDIRFLFQVKDSASIEISSEESNGFKWVSLEALKRMDSFTKLVHKINGNLAF